MRSITIIFVFFLCLLFCNSILAQDTSTYTQNVKVETTVEDQILKTFLEKASQRAMDEIQNKGTLSEENAIPLILKTQFNHIDHLYKNMVTKDEFNNLKVDFNNFRTLVLWLFGIGLAYITLIFGIVTFLIKFK